MTGEDESRARRRRRWRRALQVYIGLLIVSHVVAFSVPSCQPSGGDPAGAMRSDVNLPAMSRDGSPKGSSRSLSALTWSGANDRPPVILLHGSPSRGALDFGRFAPVLAEAGYETHALDMPGFGQSDLYWPNYSARALAHLVFAYMDHSGIERAHVLGWSHGGAVGLHMADIEEERLASLTLLGALGSEQAEGSGDHYFEHAKYAFGYLSLVLGPELLPHFGLIPDFGRRHAFIRNFWDSDLRPNADIMRRITTPTLILHGRHDFLVPAWGAELHHELIPESKLVMMDANHFIPFTHVRESSDYVIAFLDRHSDPTVPPVRQTVDLAPVEAERGSELGPFRVVHGMSWWVLILIIIFATFISEDATVLAVGILIARGDIDVAVGFIGCFLGIAVGDGALWAIGRFVGRPALRWRVIQNWLPEKALDRWARAFDRHAVKAVFLARAVPGTRVPTYLAAGVLSGKAHRFLFWALVAIILWTPLLLIIAAIVGPGIIRLFEGVFGGPAAIVAALILIFIGIRIVERLFTRAGRMQLLRATRRPFCLEFWPPFIFYLPLLPWAAWLALTRRGVMTFTCVNPGIPHGGGVVHESKKQILDGLFEGGAGEWIVPTRLIGEGSTPEERAEEVRRLLETDGAFGGFPVILKPDESQRGHAVKLARDADDVLQYFQTMTRSALLQGFHKGPLEVGVLWSRAPGAGAGEPGRIFSITRKTFPEIEGNGSSTLEELIWRHPRYRMQAPTFLKRFADQTDRILFKGERMRLAVAGNHCQGTMFLDGADLITPELDGVIDHIARSFPGDAFDFGRFDIRYESDDDLRAGRNFAIVELNGTMSESTNLYDPGRSILWSYQVLFSQWRTLYDLGAERRREGQRPLGAMELLRAIRDHYRGRPGSAVSD